MLNLFMEKCLFSPLLNCLAPHSVLGYSKQKLYFSNYFENFLFPLPKLRRILLCKAQYNYLSGSVPVQYNFEGNKYLLDRKSTIPEKNLRQTPVFM